MRRSVLLAAALLAGAAEGADRPAVIRGGVAEVGTWRHVLRPGEGGTLEALVPLPDGGIAAAGWVGRDGEPSAAWLMRLDASGMVVLDRTYPERPGSRILDLAPIPEGFLAGGSVWALDREPTPDNRSPPDGRNVLDSGVEPLLAILSPDGDVLATAGRSPVLWRGAVTGVSWLPTGSYAALLESGWLLIFRDPQDLAWASRGVTWEEHWMGTPDARLVALGEGLLSMGGLPRSGSYWTHLTASRATITDRGAPYPGAGIWLGGADLGDGRFALAGWTEWLGLEGRQAVLAVTQLSGETLHALKVGGLGPDAFSAVAVTPDGGLAAAGWIAEAGSERRDGFVLRLDADFRELWRRTIPGGGDDWFTDLLVAPDGGLILAGRSGGPEGGGWVVRLAPNGQDAEGGPLRP